MAKSDRVERSVAIIARAILVVQGNDAVFFAKSPPPPEPRQPGKHEFGISQPSQFLYERQDVFQRFFGSSVVRRYGHVATELQNCSFFGYG